MPRDEELKFYDECTPFEKSHFDKVLASVREKKFAAMEAKLKSAKEVIEFHMGVWVTCAALQGHKVETIPGYVMCKEWLDETPAP